MIELDNSQEAVDQGVSLGLRVCEGFESATIVIMIIAQKAQVSCEFDCSLQGMGDTAKSNVGI